MVGKVSKYKEIGHEASPRHAGDQRSLEEVLLSAAPAFVAYLDRDGRYVVVNNRLAELLGSTPEEVAGTDSFADERRGHRVTRSAFERALAGEGVRYQSEAVGKNGICITVENHYQPHIVDGKVVGVCLFAYDVSDRVRAARALRESRERFRSLIEIIPYGICRTDDQGRLLMTNPAHARMLGYRAGELIGRSAWDFFVPEQRDYQRGIFLRALEDRPEPVPTVARCVRKDGSHIDVLFNWTYEIDEDGMTKGLIAVMTDVTEQLATQRELVQAKEVAEHANEEKSRFLAATSHDLQQPLHSLSIMLGLLRTQKDEGRRTEVLDTMERALEGAQGLLRAVLDLSKLEAGVVTPRLESVSINDLFSQIEAELGPQTVAKPMVLRVVPSSRQVFSDRMLLKSILYNLVSNAIRYTPEGKVLLGARLRAGELSLEVWDTGVGIPKARQRDIFKEFTRLEPGQQTSGAVHSLGLGLSIVDRACQLLGHSLTLESEPGRGSVFRVSAPLAHSEATEGVGLEQYGPAVAADEGLILIVDDEQAIAEATRNLLEEWGYECMIAKDRTSAIDEAQKRGRPNLMLVDYNLGCGESGLDVVEAVSDLYGESIPAILVTGEREGRALDAARDKSIPIQLKPVNPARLRALLAFQLRRGIETAADCQNPD